MPFIAKDKRTGQRIDISRIPNPRIALRECEVICQLCGESMIVKSGLIVSAHFAHKNACGSELGTHPESAEHRFAKLYLIGHLSAEFEEYQNARFDLEVPIQEARRVADLLVTLDSGWRIAHEVQLASITIEELKERTDDYGRAGVDVVWWLGKRAATPANERWCLETFGFCVGLEFHSNTVN